MAGNDLNMRLSLQLAEKVSGPLKGISNSSRTAAGSLQATRNSLRELERQNGLVQRLRQQQAAFAATSNQLKIHQAQLQSMRNSGSATAAQIKTQTALVDKSTAAFKKQAAQVGALRVQANNAGIGNLSAAEARLGTEIARTTQQLRQQEQALRRTEQLRTQRNNGLMAAGAIGGTGIGLRMAGERGLRGAWSFLRPGVEFDATMARVQALTRLQSDSKELAMLRQQADDLGASTMFSATEAAQGQAFLAMAGFKPENIRAAMPGLLDMALAGDLDLARTADIASNISSGFGINPAEMSRVADVLTMAFTNSNVNLEMLGDTMKYVAPNARALGVSMEETAALAGLLGNVGIQGTQAGTAMRGMFIRMAAPPAAAREALKTLGVSIADAKGNMRQLPDILLDVAKATEHMGNVERMRYVTAIFGREPSSAVTELLNQTSTGDMQRFIDLMRSSQGTASKVARTMADQIKGDWDELTSAWEGFGLSINELVRDDLRSLVKWLTSVTDSFRAWTKENPELAKWIGRIVLAGLALATVLGTVLTALAPVIGGIFMFKYAMGMIGVKGLGLAAIVTKLGGVFKALGAAIFATPVGWLVMAMAGLAYAIYKNWDVVKWFISDTWDNIKTFFSSGIGNIAAMILNWSPLGLFYSAFASVLAWFGVSLPASFSEFGGMLMDGLVNGIKNAVGAVKDAIFSIGDSVVSWFREKLNINSPSKVFADLGMGIPEGTALGITRGLPLIKNAAVSMSAAAMDGLSIAKGNSFRIDRRAPVAAMAGSIAPMVSMAGDHVEIHISGAGMDAQAIASAVSAELDKRERAKAARARSAFTDRG